ncbi:MAG: hypothetical protein ACFFD9_07490 [Candidatus Thorarchaeota archaeon]
MEYCELWLETDNRQFRVALLVPDGFELPEGFSLLMSAHPSGKALYVSDWHSGITEAKQQINSAAQFYSDRAEKFLFFREIRPASTA